MKTTTIIKVTGKVTGMVFLVLAWLGYCSIMSTTIPLWSLWVFMFLLWGMGALCEYYMLRQRKETLWDFLRHNVDSMGVVVCGLLMVCALNESWGDTEIAMILGSFVLVGFVCE